MLVVIACLLGLLSIVATVHVAHALTIGQRDRPAILDHVGHLVVVHTRSGKSIRGIPTSESSRDEIVLASAELLTENSAPVSLDGRQIIALGNLDFFQAGVQRGGHE